MATADPPVRPAAQPSPSSRGATWRVSLRGSSGEFIPTSLSALDAVVDAASINACLDGLVDAPEDVSAALRAARADARESGVEAIPGRDAIARWAGLAVDGWRETDQGRPIQIGDGLGWFWPRRGIVSAARHDESVVAFALPTGVAEWQLRYTPSAFERDQCAASQRTSGRGGASRLRR